MKVSRMLDQAKVYKPQFTIKRFKDDIEQMEEAVSQFHRIATSQATNPSSPSSGSRTTSKRWRKPCRSSTASATAPKAGRRRWLAPGRPAAAAPRSNPTPLTPPPPAHFPTSDPPEGQVCLDKPHVPFVFLPLVRSHELEYPHEECRRSGHPGQDRRGQRCHHRSRRHRRRGFRRRGRRSYRGHQTQNQNP